MNTQRTSDALQKLKIHPFVWITDNDRRLKLGQIKPEEVRSGDTVLIADVRGYRIAEVSHRKGPHVGLSRWRAWDGKNDWWTDAENIRAKVIESHPK